mgnify:CR=1 FL=1
MSHSYPDTQLLIDGQWRDAADGRTLEVESPGNRQIFGTIPRGGREDVDTAAKALHFICFVVLAAAALAATSPTSRVPLALLAALTWILFNPYQLVNLYRLNDNNVNVPAIVIAWVLVQPSGRQPIVGTSAAAALVGALASVRPNVITLLPAIVFAAWAIMKLIEIVFGISILGGLTIPSFQ